MLAKQEFCKATGGEITPGPGPAEDTIERYLKIVV